MFKEFFAAEKITLDTVKVGDILIADDGFISDYGERYHDGHCRCIRPFSKVIVEKDKNGDLFVRCAAGQHLLEGQVDDDGGEIVGLRRIT